jgi:hypothetical protein
MKSDLKVDQDLLRKKWIIIKNDPQLRDFIKMTLLLQTL